MDKESNRLPSFGQGDFLGNPVPVRAGDGGPGWTMEPTCNQKSDVARRQDEQVMTHIDSFFALGT